MDHQQRLATCELCQNKGFSPKMGVVCTLTSERPAFEGECQDFSEDARMMAARRREEEDRANELASTGTIGAQLEASHGMNGRIIAGIISIVLSLAWFFGGIALMNRVFFYPIFLFGFGIYKIIDGSAKKRVEVKKKKSTLLDDEL